MMATFDKLIRAGMTVREIRQLYPETAEVFTQLGFRHSCDDCSIDVVARRQGLRAADIVAELNSLVFGAAPGEGPISPGKGSIQ